MMMKNIVVALLVITLREVVSVPISLNISTETTVVRVIPPKPSQPAPEYSSLDSPFTSLLLSRPDDVQTILQLANDTYNPRRLPTAYALIDPASLSYEEMDAFCQQQLLKVFPDGLVHEEDGCKMAYDCDFDRLRFPPVLFTGSCLNSYCYLEEDGEEELYKCAPTVTELQVFQYVLPEASEPGYQQEDASNHESLVTKGGEWTFQHKSIITDCSCLEYSSR